MVALAHEKKLFWFSIRPIFSDIWLTFSKQCGLQSIMYLHLCHVINTFLGGIKLRFVTWLWWYGMYIQCSAPWASSIFYFCIHIIVNHSLWMFVSMYVCLFFCIHLICLSIYPNCTLLLIMFVIDLCSKFNKYFVFT